jgi:hypothetical protein
MIMAANVSKCRVCREPAIIDLPRHNANFCAEHLLQLCRRQVEKAIADHDMLSPDDKDPRRRVAAARTPSPCGTSCSSSATRPTGLYIGLGIGEYSDNSASTQGVRRASAALTLIRSTCAASTATTSRRRSRAPSACRARRAACPSVTCSTRPRVDGGYDVLVTGHNLDDEAAVLFGNALRWDVEYLARQLPCCRRATGSPRR